MQKASYNFRAMMLGSAACFAILAANSAANAGGLAVREQSAQFQGSSFAGNAAGHGLSSSFWNSAAIGEAGEGLTTESDVSVIFNANEFTVQPGSHPLLTVGEKGLTNRTAILSSSYTAYRLNDMIVLGMAINAPFGIATEMDSNTGSYRLHHRSAKILTLNANPMASVEVAPGLFIAAGAQVQYIKVKFKTDSGIGLGMVPSGPTTGLDGDDIGFGYTAGLLWKPSEHTSIGVGFRSAVSHKIEGDQYVLPANFGPFPAGVSVPFQVEVTTPEMVTASLRHEIIDDLTLLATVEWTNWDRLGVIPIKSSLSGGSTLDFQWHDGWFFALGGEYEYSEALTFRAGAAYEISPVQNATERLVQVPDADRVWLSAGATLALNEKASVDFSYTHVFIDQSRISRVPASPALSTVVLNARAEPTADILSVAFKYKWGEDDE